MLEAYYDRLTVFPVDKSRVIVIDFLSEDPELAAQVTNAIADGYLQLLQQGQSRIRHRARPRCWPARSRPCGRRLSRPKARSRLIARRSNLLVGNNNTTLSAQQLGDMTSQLSAARAQKADAEAKAKLIRDMLKSGQPIEFVGHPQFRVDPKAVGTARDLARATRRAVVDAARQSSAHQGTESADRRSRSSDRQRSSDGRAFA